MSPEPWLWMKQSTVAAALAWQQGSGSTWVMLWPLVLIFAVFYFLLIRPQQSRQKKWQEMLGALKTGDRIVTGGGIRGTIMSIKEDALIVRVAPDNLKLEVMRSSVVTVTTADEK
jgi:preprotein translocase subunit YajC